MTMYDHKPGGRSLAEHPVGALHRSGPEPGKRTLVEDLTAPVRPGASPALGARVV